MKFRVLRPFKYSWDGIHTIDAIVGSEDVDFADMAEGLASEGYIEPVDEAPQAIQAIPRATRSGSRKK